MNTQAYRDAVEESRQRVAQSKTKENLQLLAGALGSLGNQLAEEGLYSNSVTKYEEAIRLHNEARAIRQSIGDYELEAQSCFNLGAIYDRGMNEIESAKKYLKEGLLLTSNHSLWQKYEPHLRDLEMQTGQVSFIIHSVTSIGKTLYLEANLSMEEFAIVRHSTWTAEFTPLVELLFKTVGFELVPINGGPMYVLKGLEGLRLTIEPKSLDTPLDEPANIIALMRPI